VWLLCITYYKHVMSCTGYVYPVVKLIKKVLYLFTLCVFSVYLVIKLYKLFIEFIGVGVYTSRCTCKFGLAFAIRERNDLCLAVLELAWTVLFSCWSSETALTWVQLILLLLERQIFGGSNGVSALPSFPVVKHRLLCALRQIRLLVVLA